MRIDAHQHFWRYAPAEYGWIAPDGPLARDHLPDDLAPRLHERSISATVAVQARQTPGETEWLLRIADQSEWVAKVVGWDDLQAEDIAERLADARAFPKLAGFRHVIQDEPDDHFMLRPAFTGGVQAALSAGFTYDILIQPRQHEMLPRFLDTVGPGRLVLDHGAKPDIRAGGTSAWAAAIRDAAAFPHLHCKISGLVTEADHAHWRADDIAPYLDHLLECFGPERLLFGSDWPVCRLAATYARVCDLIGDFIERRCPDHADAIWGGNAARFYGIAGARA